MVTSGPPTLSSYKKAQEKIFICSGKSRVHYWEDTGIVSITMGWSSTLISPPKPLRVHETEWINFQMEKLAAYKWYRWKRWNVPAACSGQTTNDESSVSRMNFCALGPAAWACCSLVIESLMLERPLRSLRSTINLTGQGVCSCLQHSLVDLCMEQPGWLPSSKSRGVSSKMHPQHGAMCASTTRCSNNSDESWCSPAQVVVCRAADNGNDLPHTSPCS